MTNPKEMHIISVTTEKSADTNSARRLSVYLNDHLDGETLALQLATRASWQHNGSPLGTFLELLSWELEEDRDSLVRLMGELGVSRRHRWSGITEKIGRLRLTGASPQRTPAELESLDRRINRKHGMWSGARAAGLASRLERLWRARRAGQ